MAKFNRDALDDNNFAKANTIQALNDLYNLVLELQARIEKLEQK
nr:MAG TPA: hypothetical protein [Bacteriophage sp.]